MLNVSPLFSKFTQSLPKRRGNKSPENRGSFELRKPRNEVPKKKPTNPKKATGKKRSPKSVGKKSKEPANGEGGSNVEPLNQYVCQRVKWFRKKKGWTLEQLSAQSGVSRSMLSQVERGAANPTLAVAFRIARAFDVSLGDLVEGAIDRARMRVIRRNDDNAIFRDDDHCRIRTLSPLNLEKDVEFYEVALNAGERLDSAAHFSGTREFLTVQSGQITVRSGDETETLKKGDSVQYRADVDHSIENTSTEEAVFFLVDIYSSE